MARARQENEMTLQQAVRELRRALDLSQQALATRAGISKRAIANYEKDRDPDSRALMKLWTLADDNELPQLAQLFAGAMASDLRLSGRGRGPLSADEHYLRRAFDRCVFEHPQSASAKLILEKLAPFVDQLRAEDVAALQQLRKQSQE